MEGKMKVALQVLFLVVLIWVCMALSGVVQGATLRIGQGSGKRHRRGRHRSYRWTATGMSGELVQNPSQSFSPACTNSLSY